MSPIVEQSRQWPGRCRATLQRVAQLEDALKDVPPGLARQIEAYEEALHDHLVATMERYAAELERHFPGMAPAIRVVWQHVQEEGQNAPECQCQNRAAGLRS